VPTVVVSSSPIVHGAATDNAALDSLLYAAIRSQRREQLMSSLKEFLTFYSNHREDIATLTICGVEREF
jgi:hypothetical protein